MKLVQLAAFAVLISAAMGAQAGPVFNYNGTCDVGNCGTFGLNNGDAVGGYIELADGALSDSVVTGNEVIDYMMTFGNQSLTTANSSVMGAITVGPGGFNLIPGIAADALLFARNGFSGLSNFGVTGSATLGGNVFEGWVASRSCGVLCGRVAGGAGGYTVPEPAVFGLLAIGLASLGLTRRKRSAV